MSPRWLKAIEYRFKDFLQGVFRLVLSPGDTSRCPVPPGQVRSILILRPDKLGDMVASIPAIHALKVHYPHMRVEVLASPHNSFLVAEDPQVDAVHVYSKNILRDWPMVLRLRQRRFSIVYDPNGLDSVTCLLLTRIIAGRGIRAASRKLRLQRYYDFCKVHDPEGRDHNYDNGLLIFEVLGVDPATIDPFLPLYLPPSSREKAQRFIQSLPDGPHLWIGVNISAGSASRTLPVEKYSQMIRRIAASRPDARFVVICTMDDRERGRDLVRRVGERAHLVPENLSLLDVSAVLDGRVQVLISPDTSLVHIARLFRIPVVGLYSGHLRNFYFWRPYRQTHGAVVAANEGNLHDIEPARVVEEFQRLLTDLEAGENSVIRRRA